MRKKLLLATIIISAMTMLAGCGALGIAQTAMEAASESNSEREASDDKTEGSITETADEEEEVTTDNTEEEKTEHTEEQKTEDTEEEVAEETEEAVEEETTEEKETPAAAEGYITIGDDAKGYVDVPEDWLDFFDPDTSGTNVVQSCSPDMSAIITIMVYDEKMVESGILTQEQLDDLDAYTLANGAYYNLETQGCENLTGATVTLDGRSSYQVYGAVSSTMMIMWFFEDEDGAVHYICVEAPVDAVMEPFGYVEDSYRLERE